MKINHVGAAVKDRGCVEHHGDDHELDVTNVAVHRGTQYHGTERCAPGGSGPEYWSESTFTSSVVYLT